MIEKEHRSTSRVLDIIELLSSSKEGYTLTEISKLINSPKSSIYPIVKTLNKRNFITLDQSSLKYTIGLNSFIVGSSYIENLDPISYIKEEMEIVVSICSETCQLGILDENQVLYIAKVDSQQPIRLASYVGKKIPAYATALGKALLSQFTDEEIKALYPDGFTSYTQNTVSDYEKLNDQLQKIRETNVAHEKEEIAEHIQCVAVPLKKAEKVIAAISVTLPTFRASKEKLNLIEMELLKAKKKIERLLDSINLEPDIFYKG